MPKAGALSPEQALAQWTFRYFLSHGPAQAKDFAWWSGLTLQEAQRGLEMLDGKLLRETIDGKTYWRSPKEAIQTAATGYGGFLALPVTLRFA